MDPDAEHVLFTSLANILKNLISNKVPLRLHLCI